MSVCVSLGTEVTNERLQGQNEHTVNMKSFGSKVSLNQTSLKIKKKVK